MCIAFLDDYALMGDSRAYGFFYYGFMPDERVFAKPGATINMIPERLDELRAGREGGDRG